MKRWIWLGTASLLFGVLLPCVSQVQAGSQTSLYISTSGTTPNLHGLELLADGMHNGRPKHSGGGYTVWSTASEVYVLTHEDQVGNESILNGPLFGNAFVHIPQMVMSGDGFFHFTLENKGFRPQWYCDASQYTLGFQLAYSSGWEIFNFPEVLWGDVHNFLAYLPPKTGWWEFSLAYSSPITGTFTGIGEWNGEITIELYHSPIPLWWVARNIVNTNSPPDDYAPVNQGQLKHIAYQAYLELEGTLFGAGDSVAQRVSSISDTDNYSAVNLGQLKYLSAPFYEHLLAIGMTNAWPQGMSSGPYPWSGSPHPAQDYAMANIGQAKHLFSFDIQVDTDGDGIPDWWEIFYFDGPTNAVASADPDGDGLTNLEEYHAGTHPLCAYVEAYGFDRFADWLEGASGEDGLMILLPSGQFRHVTEPLLAIFSYGVYGGE